MEKEKTLLVEELNRRLEVVSAAEGGRSFHDDDDVGRKYAATNYTGSENDAPKAPIFVVCRRGNDSQIAVSMLKSLVQNRHTDSGGEGDSSSPFRVSELRDIAGGLHAWARRIDSTFPVY